MLRRFALRDPELGTVAGRIVEHVPLGDAFAFDDRFPECWTVERFLVAGRRTDHDDSVLLTRGLSECVAVVGEELEELCPDLTHSFVAARFGTGLVHEEVSLGHEFDQAVEITRVNAVVELEGDCSRIRHR